MVRAAHQQLPGISNRLRVRTALEAACALIPERVESVCDVPVIASIRVIVDEAEFHRSAVEAVHKLRAGLPLDGEGKVSLADLEATLPQQVRDAMAKPQRYLMPPQIELTAEQRAEFEQLVAEAAQGPMTILKNAPQAAITFNRPLNAAGVTEIATRLKVAKSTVTGWATRREQNGMPEPVWQLASGAVYDLDAVVEWHGKWKSDVGGTIGANDGGG